MNFLTIMGLASVNEDFRRLLCSKGAAAVREWGLTLVLSQDEIDKLNSLQSDPQLCGALENVATAFCRVGPCPRYPSPVRAY